MSSSIIFPDLITVAFQAQDQDAFNRLRVSQPQSVWDVYHLQNKSPLKISESVVGVGASSTYNASRRSVLMAVGTAAAETVIRQSRQYAYYQPGRGALILATGVLGPSKANVRQRVGYFDDDNGLFFEQTGAGKFLGVRTNTSGAPVTTLIPQASWNLDPMDGSGPSGVNVDYTMGNLFVIDFQWLGVGRVRFGFFINGQIIYCHEIFNGNNITVVFMGTPNLPIRYEITNTGISASSTTLEMICAAVFSEGGEDSEGYPLAANTGVTEISGGTGVQIGLLGVRALSSSPRLIWEVEQFTTMGTGAQNYRVQLLFAPTISGGTWNAVGTNSFCEFNSTIGTSFSGGTSVWAGYASQLVRQLDRKTQTQLRAGSDVAGTTRDAWLITATAINGTAQLLASMNWREIY